MIYKMLNGVVREIRVCKAERRDRPQITKKNGFKIKKVTK